MPEKYHPWASHAGSAPMCRFDLRCGHHDRLSLREDALTLVPSHSFLCSLCWE